MPGAQAATEDTALAITGISVNDVDGNLATSKVSVLNGNLTVSLAGGASISSGANNSGTLTLSGTQAQINAALASISYKGVQDFNGSDTLTVLSTDSLGATDSDSVAITVAAVNDAAIISGTTSGTVIEASGVANAVTGTPTASFTLTDADVDNPANTFQAVVAGAATANGYGTYAMTAGGTWTYTLNNNNATVQALRTAANTLVDTFTVLTVDGTAQLITVSIQGGNDTPIAVADSSAAVTEQGVNPGNTAFAGNPTATGNVLTNDTDVDAGDTKTLTLVNATAIAAAGNTVIAGKYGNLSIAADGSYTYTLNNADPDTQALAQGQTVTDEVFNYTMKDTAGATSASALTINITGTNDVPVAVGTNNTANEDVAFVAVVINGTDVDGTIATFNLSSLPTNGALYTDAALTILAVTGFDYTATGNARTFYFKPAPDFNSGVLSGSVVPSFNFTATDNNGAVSNLATETITITPVSDGQPDGTNDSFQTLLGTPITFTRAQLLANDFLPDHATIDLTSALPAGLVYDVPTQTYTWTPAATGTSSFTYTLIDDDGQGSVLPVNTTVTLTAYISRDDLATINESALLSGTGGGVKVFSGNLFTNDTTPLGGNITAINAGTNTTFSSNTTAVVGPDTIRTVITSYGTLVVNQATGAYTYTLNNKVDNDSQTGADTNEFLETFNYVRGATGNANLIVTIKDDAPVATNSTVYVDEGSLPTYNLTFVLDTSGSMAYTEKSVDANGVATSVTRMSLAIAAIKDLVNTYYSQTQNISIKLVTFDSVATYENTQSAYASKAAFFAALDSPVTTPGNGTNYQAGLDSALTALGTVNTAQANIVYFISDGVPTSGDITDPGAPAPAGNGYRNFVNANGVQSIAVGIGTGIPDPTELNNIHNVDANKDGVKDSAIIVADVNKLSDALLATVPQGFGGSVTGAAGGTASLNMGADGGFISSLTMNLDTNANGIPDTNVTFNFNPAGGTPAGSGLISVVGGFPAAGFPLNGDLLTFNNTNGFTKGSLVFNFRTGAYSYLTNGVAVEGDQFTINYVATDNDGDTITGQQTVIVKDGQPRAFDDFDSLFVGSTSFDGNVISGISTDGANGVPVTTLGGAGAGQDSITDNAKVTSIVFKGVTLDLTTIVGSTAAAGGTYTVALVGGVKTLTWTATTGGASLVFNQEGYYNYIPPTAEVPTNLTLAPVTLPVTTSAEITAAATAGVTLAGIAANSIVEGTATVTAGAGITGGSSNTLIDTLESMVINFSTALNPHGVQGISITTSAGTGNLGTNTNSGFSYRAYNVAGELIGQFSSGVAGAVNMPAYFTGVTKIIVDSNGFSSGIVTGISYASTGDIVPIAPLSVSVSDVIVAENVVGGQAFFTISLSQASASNVVVTYNTSNRTGAGNPGDYTAIGNTTVTFLPGETTKTVAVTITNDATAENNLENFNLNIVSATGGTTTVLDNVGIATIVDDDTARRVIQVSNAVVTEGQTAVFNVNFKNAAGVNQALAANSTFTLALGNALGAPANATLGADYLNAAGNLMQYSLNNGTTWTDYTGANIAVTAGSTGFLVRVVTVSDDVIEGSEYFGLTVARAGGDAFQAGNNSIGGVATLLDYIPVRVANAPNEIIGYTLTDSNGDISSATLHLSNISNSIAGTLGGDTLTGTVDNDYIGGLAGNDTITGGAGFDIIKGGDGNDNIDGGADDDQLFGGAGDDTILGGAGNDYLYGEAGNDNLDGGAGNDLIKGGAGADTIIGGTGADIIAGGAGNDVLTGGIGGLDTTTDTFKWELADKGVSGTPASDTITDFNIATPALGGDVLDVRDLLVGENHVVGVGNLASFLHFEKTGTDTIVHISNNGSYAAGFNAAQDVQTITLTGVDLVTGFANDQAIIADLLTKNKLITD